MSYKYKKKYFNPELICFRYNGAEVTTNTVLATQLSNTTLESTG